jgi:hypothetical protein
LEIASRGTPVLLFISTAFAPLITAMQRKAGLDTLHVYVMPHPFGTRSGEFLDELADAVLTERGELIHQALRRGE